MSACEHFTQNAWRPDLCSTCQRAKSEHDGISGPRSWRRKSEPNPNNAITGVRISALASKFQARQTNESIAETEAERATTLDRRIARSKDKTINTSRSTELLDSSILPPLLSSLSSTSSSTSAITNSNHITEHNTKTSQVKTDSLKWKSSNLVSTTLSPTPSLVSATTSSSSNRNVTDACSDKNSQQHTDTVKTKLTSAAINSSRVTVTDKSHKIVTNGGQTKVKVLPSSGGKPSSQFSTSSGTTTTSSSIKSNPIQSSRKESTQKLSTTHSSSSITSSSTSSSVLPNQKTDKVNKEVDVSKGKLSRLKLKQRRVSIPDQAPQVIGHDGGLDNLLPDEDTTEVEDTGYIYFSLTDEEKQFALLALGNTVWNSDTRNLQVEPDVSIRACREFEDVCAEQLWHTQGFKSLVNCDPKKKWQDSGTFPQKSSSKQLKVSVKSLSFSTEDRVRGGLKEGDTRSCRFASEDGRGDIKVEKVNNCHMPGQVQSSFEWLKSSLSSNSERKVKYGSNCSNAGFDVDTRSTEAVVPQEQHLLSTAVDKTEKSTNKSGQAHVGDEKSQNLAESLDMKVESNDPNMLGLPHARSRLVNTGKYCDTNTSTETVSSLVDRNLSPKANLDQSSSLIDSTGQEEESQAVTLLNDVLKDYGNFNESSTDDVFAKVVRTDSQKSMTDFEARMASVAATLDLTKQQRGKKQAPRPPVSPPPEPNLAETVSPKKVINQPDPVFKMVTVGKSIVTLPPQLDMPPKTSKPSIISYGLDDFGSLSEVSDNMNNKTTNGDGKSKKGITSFLRNILRRGKETSESFESANPDVQLHVRVDKKDSSAAVGGSIDLTNEDVASSSLDQKLVPKLTAPVTSSGLPSASPLQKHDDDECIVSNVETDNDGDVALQSELNTTSLSSDPAATSESSIKASQPKKNQNNKGLASPKLMPKLSGAKFSPTSSHRIIKDHQEKELDVSVSSSSTKPYPTSKPAVPPPSKPSTTSAPDIPPPTSTTTVVKEVATLTQEKESPSVPVIVQRRPKSPKRTNPPVPPARTTVVTGKSTSSEQPRSADITKELEWRLRKPSTTDQSGGGTLPRSEQRESTRRSLPVPPSPPAERKDKPSTAAASSGSPPVSPIKEIENSLPSSPSSPTGISFDFPTTEWSGGSTSTIDDELPTFSEKIELPTVAPQSRKGFLGKLGGNRKTRAPQPPSVKRAKSITQSSTLPRGDKKNKKINVADISGPVMVTDMTNVKVVENRRNTISLGDEPAFVAMSISCLHTGSTNSSLHPGGAISSVSIDKSGFDEFDFPVLSPLGSLENLYESILPKPEGNLFHYYDPPTSPKLLYPNIPSDGYLEPVPPLSSMAATTVTLPPSSSISLSAASTTTINLSSSTSLSPSTTTNTSVVKLPLKSNKSSRIDRTIVSNPTNPKDYGASQSSLTPSASSSETNSAENSGSSLPDSAQISAAGGTLGSITVTSGIGVRFVEPEMTEQRRILLAAQPIYEEIPNGGDDELDNYEDNNFNEKKVSDKSMFESKKEVFSESFVNGESGSTAHRAVLPLAGGTDGTKNPGGHFWLQQSYFVGTPSQTTSSATSLSSSTVLLSSLSSSSDPSLRTGLPSPSHSLSKQTPATSTMSLSSSSSMSTSQIMSTSLTSSMLPPPPPPPENLHGSQTSVICSASRETVSSESDTQSNCSNEAQSNCSTLSRPRPAPRRTPKRSDTGTYDQYVSMNRPNAQVSLSEDKLRDVFTKLTSITFHTLQDIYGQCEKILSLNRLDIPNSKLLKWSDFDIYGQPLHASGRCVVYNAKLRVNSLPCQIMILHSRPATEMCTVSHPSLLRPAAVFADTIPFSYLTPDFIKTSQLLQNSVYDASQARCFIAVGCFEIVESLDSHLALLRETLAQDLNTYLNIVLSASLQLLSAMSHCLDQGFSVTETDYSDVFLISRSDLHGKVVAFLPRQRSLDVPQGEAMCNFLERLLTDNIPNNGDNGDDDDNDDIDHDDEDDDEEDDKGKIISAPKKVLSRLQTLLMPGKVECLGHVRTAVEYLLWGPAPSELSLLPARVSTTSAGTASGASREQELYVWLEKERLSTVGRLARNVSGLGAGLSVDELYTLKFLLKTSTGCLAESFRRLCR